MTIKIILADDHNIVRAGLKVLLESSDNTSVIAEAENGRETVSLARKLNPDIVVMDVSMPDMNGIDATHKLRRLAPDVKVLALSGHSDGKLVRGMLEAGARGYLLKSAATTELLTAIASVSQGSVYISPAAAEVLSDEYLPRTRGIDESVNRQLSNREREVLQLVAEGHSSTDIADILSLSKRTVETHRKRIMDRLELRSVAELTKYAIREGITSIDD